MSLEDDALQDVKKSVATLARVFEADVANRENQRRSESTALIAFTRPFIKAYYAEKNDANENKDMRSREFFVCLTIWDVTKGRGVDAIMLARGEWEALWGLSSLPEYLQGMFWELHEGQQIMLEDAPELLAENIRKRVVGIRTALWRGNGKATTRFAYSWKYNKYLYQLDIANELPLD